MDVHDNTILITGGTSGFGFIFASRLLSLGNNVIITGRNEEKLQEVKRKLPMVHIIQSDVSSAEDILDLYNEVTRQFPKLNILINNAGEMRKISLQTEHTLTDITREIEINLMGPIRMVQQFLPHLKKQQNPAILNVTSAIALMAFPVSPVYSASKSGLRSYTQALRVQLKYTSIRVVELVAPGAPTPLNDKFKNEEGFNPRALMDPEKIVEAGIKGLQKDKTEVFPGMAKIALVLSRLAPKFALSYAGKIGASFMYGPEQAGK